MNIDDSRYSQPYWLQRRCAGVVPLTARLEPWIANRIANKQLHSWIDRYGSPLNVLCVEPFGRNVRDLTDVASEHGLDFRVFFARKSNKAICFVDSALATGCGLDVASESELSQTMDRGAKPNDIVCTAAIKDQNLIELCIRLRITLTIDNTDELSRIAETATRMKMRASVALRLAGFHHDGTKLYSRFGVDVSHADSVSKQLREQPLDLEGLHFHLHGHSVSQRVSAIDQSLVIASALQGQGHPLRFLDIGGSVPMSYLGDASQYETFWKELKKSLLGLKAPITYRGHGLGMLASGADLVGTPNVYAYYQPLVRGEWFGEILSSLTDDGQTIGQRIAQSGLQLRMEPGRSILDGCGITIARVEHRKQHSSGDWFIGCSMNRTQCRTTDDDFLVDPLLITRVDKPESAGFETELSGYLVGAYCTESELLSLRKLRFPDGVHVGDLVVFPNTAGYLMHFLESRSHQFPLAMNLVVSSDDLAEPELDLIHTMP